MKRLSLFLLAAAIFTGTIAGLVTSRPARATTYFDLYVQPGGDSSSMTCGWHGATGCPNLDGYALDWSSLYGPGVTWRSYGTAVPTSQIGTGYPGDASSTCTRLKVQVRSTADIWRGDVVYTHSEETTTSSFAIQGGDVLTPAFTSNYLGYTVTSEISGCPWKERHVHQYNSASGADNIWYHNTGTYPYAPGTGNWDPYSTQYWQSRTSWSQ
jgi:hypothetical protein